MSPLSGSAEVGVSADGDSTYERSTELAERRPDGTPDGMPTVADPELAEVLTAWPSLAEPIRRAVLGLVRSVRTGDGR
ncbi:MAG: hypothetical protein IPM18_12095 [Phycisphaerales bacterium]|nr:hypothetical protein [Phycisphaerales bacterium]